LGYFSCSHKKGIHFTASVKKNHFKAGIEHSKFQALNNLPEVCAVYVRQG